MKQLILRSFTLLSLVNLTGCADLLKLHQQAVGYKKTEPVKKEAKLSSVDQTQIGRYITIKEEPSKAQINPLLAVSTFKFNTSVYTVGDAVNRVLANTGYNLSPHLINEVKQTLEKPLPVTDRRLGPIKIQTALEVLMGQDVFILQRDPLHRLVSFKVKPSISRALGVKKNA